MSDSDSYNGNNDSDQDSSDEKPGIKSIIREKTKIFKNESYVIKILLSHHHRSIRNYFFINVRRTHNSIYQAIKREIRNCLNPYRIFLGKNTQVSKELKELYNLLKNYYKEKNFNNTFFVNYFKNLEDAHKNKNKSKYLSNLPKDEIETLNDLQRKVTIIKTLKHYLNTTIRDRIQINFEQKKDMFEKDDFIMMYKYMTIKENKFSSMTEEELMQNISNKKGSYKLRRPLNDFNVYNYIPILCKGYCQNEANLFIQLFERKIHEHGPKCKKCKELYQHLDEIKSQIKSIYAKTCIFSHNINEIMFHPIVFCSDINNPFYIEQFNKKVPEIKNIEDIVDTTQIVSKYRNQEKYDIRYIYNREDNDMKEIYNLLREYSLKNDLYHNGCYLPEYKTNPCPIKRDIDFFQPKEEDFSTHKIKCPYYHNSLEKRRNMKIRENKICKEVIEDGKWKIDEENIKCKNEDTCNKFHTRNELFYDERNFRKLYPCSNTYDYCLKGKMCPKKHPTDMKIDEMYLPLESKNELETELRKVNEKQKKIQTKEEKLSKIQCKCCLNYVDGEDGRNLYKYINCNHIICSKCNDFYKSCPLCGFNNNYKGEEDKILIKLDYEMHSMQENEDEENEEYEDSGENEEDNQKENYDDINEDGEDEDVDDPDKTVNESENEEIFINRACNEVTYSGSEDEEKDNTPEVSMAKDSVKSKKEKESEISQSYSIDESNDDLSRSIETRGRGRGRGGRGGRGRGGRGGRGERGRGGRGRGNPRGNIGRGRGRGGYSNNYNNYSNEESEKSSSSNEDDKEASSENNDVSKSNEIDDTDMSMAKNARERGNQRGRGGTIRGRGGRGRGNNTNNFKEDKSESSEEEDNSMNNKTKKFNNDENDEESD